MKNGVAKWILMMGIITILGGFISSLVMYSEFENGKLSTITFFSAFISGMMLIGFSEVIQLLAQINYKMREKTVTEDKGVVNSVKKQTKAERYRELRSNEG